MFTGENGTVAIMWLVTMIVLLIVEGVVPGLVSIWFAAGALVALLAALLGAQLWLQLVLFLLVSVVLLILTRPLAKKYVNSRTTPTNADRIIGADCLVTEEIDNLRGTGAVSVDGKTWTARMAEDDGVAQKGAILKVLRIEGVRLIVEKR
jgi:membrane protein implicated in regulation of membrane protease activity